MRLKQIRKEIDGLKSKEIINMNQNEEEADKKKKILKIKKNI